VVLELSQIVLVWLLLYGFCAVIVSERVSLPDRVRLRGPFVSVSVTWAVDRLNDLVDDGRLLRPFASVGAVVVCLVTAGVFVAFVLTVGWTLLGFGSGSAPEQFVIGGPTVFDTIAGVLPLAAVAFLTSLTVHEAGHVLVARAADIDIEAVGLRLFALVPSGVFVSVDVDSRDAATRFTQLRLYTAGISTNLAFALVATALLIGPVSSSIALAAGVPVGATAAGSAGATAGIESGDLITAVEGRPVANTSEFEAVQHRLDRREVTVSLRGGETVTATRAVSVVRARAGMPTLAGNESEGRAPVVRAVNTTAIHTDGDFEAAVANRTVVRLVTTAGNVTLRSGAYIERVVPASPLAEAGAPTDGTSLLVTRVDSTRIHDAAAFERALSGVEAGQPTTLVAYVDGHRRNFTVEAEPGERPRDRLGVTVVPGTNGVVVDDLGIDPYPARRYLTALGGGAASQRPSMAGQAATALLAPTGGATVPGVRYGFAGFGPTVSQFFVVGGGLPAAVVFALATLLLWLVVGNVVVGIMNAVPTYPFDGGNVLYVVTEATFDRVGSFDPQIVAAATYLGTTALFVVGLVVLFVASLLL